MNINKEILSSISFSELGKKFSSNNSNSTQNGWWDTYHPNYTILNWKNEPNKTEQAYRIIKTLLEEKIIKLASIKQFMDLMEKLVIIL